MSELSIRPATRKGNQPVKPELNGQRFGRLLAGHAERIGTYWYIHCICDCGKPKSVRKDHLESGKTSSCGCYKVEATKLSNTKHGDCRRVQRKAPEFIVWARMTQRCLNPNNKAYPRYGGRGISVCQEWQESYEAFLAHVGRRPSHLHSIERIDNDGNYEPGNVRWATKVEQCNNRRTNRFIDFKGKRQTFAQWGRELGISQTTIRVRIVILGWSVEKALTTPVI